MIKVICRGIMPLMWMLNDYLAMRRLVKEIEQDFEQVMVRAANDDSQRQL